MYKKLNRFILCLAILAFIGTYSYQKGYFRSALPLSNVVKSLGDSSPSSKIAKLQQPKSGLVSYLGGKSQLVIKNLGQPERKDPTPYGYSWWVYGEATENEVLVGVENGQVVTLFVLGSQLKSPLFPIGATYNALEKKYHFSAQPGLSYLGMSFQFQLSSEDLVTRPLVKLSDGNWAELYFDQFTGKLTSVRYLTPKILIEQRPFSLEYEGVLPKNPLISQSAWDQIDQAEEKEIIAISNVFRGRHQVQTLQWSNPAGTAAFLHSKEMDQKKYFSHDSKWQGDLSHRLAKQKITFRIAGENIAAHYEDGISATIGWLNSAEHRKNLLDPDFTQLGVGVYHDYYTQDFILPF